MRICAAPWVGNAAARAAQYTARPWPACPSPAIAAHRRRCLWPCAALYLDALITGTFEAKRYALPAQVYARPWSSSRARSDSRRPAPELEALGYRRVTRAQPRRVRGGRRLRVHSRGFAFPDGVEAARLARITLPGTRHGLSSAGAPSISCAWSREDRRYLSRARRGSGPGAPRRRARDPARALCWLIEDRASTALGLFPTGIARAALANLRSGTRRRRRQRRSPSSWSRTTT
jgi:penicillin-binding protein 1B